MKKENVMPSVKRRGEKAQTAALNAIAFARNHPVPLAAVAGAVLLASVMAAAYAFQQRRSELAASGMLLHAGSQAQREMILDRHPSSSAAPVALLALASGAFHAGEHEQAHAHYERFLEQYPAHPMRRSAELGKLMCREALGHAAEALEGFAGFIAAAPDHYLAPQALFGKARCLRALGRYSDAAAVYEGYISAHPDCAWAPVAESALTFLEMEMRSGKNAG